MTHQEDVISSFARYATLLQSALRAACAFAPQTEDATTIQVERGIVLARAVQNPLDAFADVALVERLIDIPLASQRLTDFTIVDRSGHPRPILRPLLLYSWLVAFRIRYEILPREQFGRWDESLRAWCDQLEADLVAPAPNARGDAVAEAAWTALALFVAGKIFIRDAWTDLAGDTFGRIVRAQQPSGALLAAAPGEHPELTWYHELATLHAMASYAVQSEDRPTARAVARAADFAGREIQPDHATTQPWGLFAFIWNPPTRPLADQQLHALSLRGGDIDGVSLILLADALYCVKLFL